MLCIDQVTTLVRKRRFLTVLTDDEGVLDVW
jgi:hypothetical protein